MKGIAYKKKLESTTERLRADIYFIMISLT